MPAKANVTGPGYTEKTATGQTQRKAFQNIPEYSSNAHKNLAMSVFLKHTKRSTNDVSTTFGFCAHAQNDVTSKIRSAHGSAVLSICVVELL